MRFIADSMLGRLAKWLRILGYDTLYYPHIDDSLLLRIAREDERILLTRDTRLVKVRGLKDFIFIEDDKVKDQLRQILSELHYREATQWSPLLFSRCVHCNGLLSTISQEEAEGRVPDFVSWRTEAMRQCLSCNKIYWRGTHPDKIKKRLRLWKRLSSAHLDGGL